MEFEFLILLSLVLFFAALIHGSIGFGFPMVATPLIALFTDIQTAIIYTLIPNLLVNIISIASEGNFFDALKKFYPLVLFTLVGSAVGTIILIYSNSDIFKLLLSIAILFYLVLDKIDIQLKWIEYKPKLAVGMFGTTAGLIGGLTNAMAPILIMYSLQVKYSKKDFIQASNLCFLFGKAMQIVLFSLTANFATEELIISSMMLFVIAVALFFGIKVKKLIDIEVYKKIVKIILFIIAIVLFIQVI